MAKDNKRNNSLRPRNISRRHFIKLAAAAGMLAGCSSTQQPDAVPTSETPDVPTLTPKPATAPRRPEVIKMYPDISSKVVQAHHAGVWDGETLVPEALQQMLDASITELTGLNDATEAWAALFAPDERIAIKVNTIGNSEFWTHVPLVVAVTECIQEAGVPAEQIVIFDRYTLELEDAGYPTNKDGPGVRCHGTDMREIPGWKLLDSDIKLSDVLLNCDALINMPILKQHTISGISFAMKNHYGTFDKPANFHSGERIERGIAALNALEPIKERTRLIIGDALNIVSASATGWYSAVTGDSVFMSFDPVAHDMAGLQLFSEVWTIEGRNPDTSTRRATPWLKAATELKVGTNDPGHTELVEVTL